MEEGKIIIPHRVSRGFVCNHPGLIFIFGRDILGKACLGQAWSCMNEPNTVGIPTMVKYCSSRQLFSDDYNAASYKLEIDEAIARIPLDGRPIIMLPKIGRGCSRMFEVAPKLYAYMIEQLNKIRYHNIEIDYSDA